MCSLLFELFVPKSAFGLRRHCVRLSRRRAASGQRRFVWGLVACWQSQSLRITFPLRLFVSPP